MVHACQDATQFKSYKVHKNKHAHIEGDNQWEYECIAKGIENVQPIISLENFLIFQCNFYPYYS